MRAILLGPPGAGKGTQATAISKKLWLAHIASGDLFREEQEKGTHLGLLAKQYMERGELVPNEITIQMILDRITRADCAQGYILDGFPRNLEQARALEEGLLERGLPGIDKVLFINVSPQEMLKRLGGRWVCRMHQHPYQLINAPPKTPGKCDIDGSELYQRADDAEETVRRRIDVYLQQTDPLIQHYEGSGRLVRVDGEQGIEEVGKALAAVLH